MPLDKRCGAEAFLRDARPEPPMHGENALGPRRGTNEVGVLRLGRHPAMRDSGLAQDDSSLEGRVERGLTPRR